MTPHTEPGARRKKTTRRLLNTAQNPEAGVSWDRSQADLPWEEDAAEGRAQKPSGGKRQQPEEASAVCVVQELGVRNGAEVRSRQDSERAQQVQGPDILNC